MSKEYLKLLSLNRSEGDLSFEECQKVNDYLATMDISSIPQHQYSNVKDYISQSLNAGSVKENLIRPLDDLLQKLEAEDT